MESRSQFGSETCRRFAVKGDRVPTDKLEARICKARTLVLEIDNEERQYHSECRKLIVQNRSQCESEALYGSLSEGAEFTQISLQHAYVKMQVGRIRGKVRAYDADG